MESFTTNETSINIVRFDALNYAVFFMMLIISALIGIYFGCFGSKQKTVDEYILGGKTMKAVPVALSLIASGISGITLIGVPAEVYTNDAVYWLEVPSFFLVSLTTYYLFLPVFLNLEIISVYEYLELRFDRSIRSVTSAFYNITYIIYLPTVIYIPSLSLSQVTGVNLHVISIGVTAVCVFYTMIGGLKAVIWTDFFQTTITLAACFVIVIIGTINIGGFEHVFNVARENGKLDIFDMEFNPLKRNTFWSVLIGTLVAWTFSAGTSQGSIQRFKSLKSPDDAKLVLIIYAIGVGLLTTISVYGGLLTYATYFGCDPIAHQLVKQEDQIYPFYVLDKIGYVPVLPGLFIAGIFSAALSTLSSVFNTVAGTIYLDYVKQYGVSESKAQIFMKSIIVILGIFSVGMVAIIEKMGKVLSVSYTITSVTSAPVCVLFCLGLMFPWANTKGAIAAAITSATFLAWITTGASLAKVNFMTKNVYPIDNCTSNNLEYLLNNSTSNTGTDENEEIFFLYKLSYMLYMPVGMTVGIVVGLIVSFLTGPTDPATVDPILILPPLRRFLPNLKNNKTTQQEIILLNKNISK